MTERERLIELISEAKDIYHTMPLVNGCKPEFEYFLADHLLANGVIVPPCKVGDTLYDLTTVDTEKELNVNEIFCGTAQGFSFDGKTIWISASYTNGLFYYHRSNEIGKTVFLSRELAEKALSERSNG